MTNAVTLGIEFSKSIGCFKPKIIICWITSLIGLCNGFYFQQVMGRSFDLLFLARLMAYTILTGVMLVTLLVLGRQLGLHKREREAANQLIERLKQTYSGKENDPVVTVSSERRYEDKAFGASLFPVSRQLCRSSQGV